MRAAASCLCAAALLVVVVLPHGVVSIAAEQQQQQQQQAAHTYGDTAAPELQPLATFYLHAATPRLEVVPDPPAGREGITRITARLSKDSVSPFVPVVTASPELGMLHSVVDAWEFLQMYAAAHEYAELVSDTRRRYPVPGVVLNQASTLVDPSTLHDDILDALISESEAGQPWTHRAAPSAMLVLPGRGVAAVADVANVSAAGADIVFTFDVVHRVHTFSEFKPHGLQHHDERAHYHFFPPPGVETDAAKFQAALKEASFVPPALHVFIKGLPDMQWAGHLHGTAY